MYNHEMIEPINPIAFSIGNINVYWYALFIVFALYLGIYLVMKEAKRFSINTDHILDLILYTIPIAFLGARFYYVIFEWENYASQPLSIFAIWQGGLAIHGALIAGLIFIIYYTRKKNITTLLLLDIIVPALLLGQAIGRWGNFMNQEAHGGIVPGANLDAQRTFLEKTLHLPEFIVNGMYINGFYYHPTFLYESIWNIIGVLIMIFIFRKIIKGAYGTILGFYMIWYGIGRFWIENLRTDSLMYGDIQVARLISILMIIIGMFLIAYVNTKKDKKIYKEQRN